MAQNEQVQRVSCGGISPSISNTMEPQWQRPVMGIAKLPEITLEAPGGSAAPSLNAYGGFLFACSLNS